MPKTNTDQTPAFTFAERVAAEIRRTQLGVRACPPEYILSEQAIRGIVLEQLRFETTPLVYAVPATDRALEETGSRIVEFDVPVTITFPVSVNIPVSVTAVASTPLRQVVELAKQKWTGGTDGIDRGGFISNAFDVHYERKDVAEMVFDAVEKSIADGTLKTRFPRSGEVDDIERREL